MNTLRTRLLALLLCLWSSLPGNVTAQQQGPQLVDSLETHQERIDELIRGRLNSVVPSGNFILRVLVVGQPIQVPLPTSLGGVSGDLPGFKRETAQPERTEEKFRIDQINVRIVINEDIASSEQEYIRTIVPLLAEFREGRNDELDLQVVPPDPEAAVEDPPIKLEWRDWLLLGSLGLILLLLLILLVRVLMAPRPRLVQQLPAEAPPPAPAPAPAPATPGREEQEALQKMERAHQLDSLKHSVIKGLFARKDLGQQLIQNWLEQPAKVSGLVQALGPIVARQALLPHLDRERYQALEQSSDQDASPTLEAQLELLREANLFLVAQDLIQPEEIRPDPFLFLSALSRGQVAHLIREEPVRIKAIVLSRIGPRDTAQILDGMPKEMQLEVAVQIGNFQDLPLDMAEDVGRELAVKSRNLPDAKTVDIHGTRKLVELMTHTSHDTSRYLLNAIKSKDIKLSEAVEKNFFMFDAIPLVPPEFLPQVIRTLPSDTIIQALYGADPEIQRQVIMAFPERSRNGMVTSLRASQFDENTVLEARQQIVSGFQSLAEQGKIDLKQISEAFQAQAS